MSHPLRVLQVATIMNQAGLETFIMNLYRNINRDLVQFDFLLHRDAPGYYDDEIKSLGGQIFHTKRANPLSYAYYSDLNNFFQTHPEYRVVHSHIDCMSSLPLHVARQNNVPVRIAHAHSSKQDFDVKYPIKSACKRFIKNEATHLFACGEEAGKWMFSSPDFHVIPNGIDVDKYAFSPDIRHKVRTSLGIADSTLVLGHIGRFSRVKNHEFLIKIFKDFVSEHIDSKLLLVGDGELLSEIKALVDSFGCADKVIFMGSRSDVYALVQAMDVFVMPSLYEGLPLVAVEAQASGLPCVFSTGVPRECDILGNSAFVDLGDYELHWIKAIEFAAVNQPNRKEASFVVRNAGFDVKQVASGLEGFYLDSVSRVM